jgi:hypothetical protein
VRRLHRKVPQLIKERKEKEEEEEEEEVWGGVAGGGWGRRGFQKKKKGEWRISYQKKRKPPPLRWGKKTPPCLERELIECALLALMYLAIRAIPKRQVRAEFAIGVKSSQVPTLHTNTK